MKRSDKEGEGRGGEGREGRGEEKDEEERGKGCREDETLIKVTGACDLATT